MRTSVPMVDSIQHISCKNFPKRHYPIICTNYPNRHTLYKNSVVILMESVPNMSIKISVVLIKFRVVVSLLPKVNVIIAIFDFGVDFLPFILVNSLIF